MAEVRFELSTDELIADADDDSPDVDDDNEDDEALGVIRGMAATAVTNKNDAQNK